MKRLIVSFYTLLSLGCADEAMYYYASGKKIPLTPLHETRTSYQNDTTWYRLPDGTKVGVKPEVIIGCNVWDKCKQIMKNYPIEKVEKLSDKLYLLKLKQGSDPITIANKLYLYEAITLAHPNFIRKRKLR